MVSMGEIKQALFCAELKGGQHLTLVVMDDDRLALMIDGQVERIWDPAELGTNGAVSSFLSTCRRTGTVPRTELTHTPLN
jgi:hypothetical protein